MSTSRLVKLRAMPPREIAHRIAYSARTAIERRAHARGRLTVQAGPPARRVLQRTASPRFFAWQDDPDAFRVLFQTRYASELETSRRLAEQVAQGEVSFFGRTFRVDAGVNWHADPVTGAEWPRRYHRDVPVHGGNVGFGDVKYVWELNRHQFLVDLAKVAFLDRDARYANATQALLRSWRRDVPYATGAPWACALEPAFRAWSWMWAYELLCSAGLLAADDHLEWLDGFFDHGRFLNRHLELYASPYNHLIGEAAALFALGVLFPEFDEAPQWTRRGRKVLETALGSQFFADGGTVEQSTFYHHATLGFYLLAMLLAERNRITLSDGIRQAAERGLQFSMALMQPDGRMPSIGGADDGKPIRMEHLPFWDFRPYLAAGSVMFTRPDFKAAAGRFFEDACWLLGADGARRFDKMTSRAPEPCVALPASGYYVARNGAARDADYVCFDCGAQAGGLRTDDVPSAAHGHADCLSVIVTLGRRQVLVDPGFFCYNGDPEWEVYFRKTAAHNTLTVDGRDQARHISKMAWARTYTPAVEGWSARGRLAWARGSHDGFARGDHGVVHRRTVWLRPDGYVVLYDEIVGSGSHTVQANFQFAPGSLTVDGQTALYDGRFEIVWACSTAPRAAVRCGEDGPGGGWVAQSLGVREPAPRLTVEFPFAGPRTALLTVLADRARVSGAGRRIETLGQTAGMLAARVRLTGVHDEVFAAAGTHALPRGIETDAPLVTVRIRNGRVIDAAHAGGTRVRVSGMDSGEAAREPAVAAMNASRFA
jgi:Heparinase II/III-like protein/Heparinase II/III N-terminus